ncbi:hypothetical protein [Maribacter sp.]|uniref:hypothetical protein n=1 Tax=Maribacter sp. TaxID=1897614 RepID=UPI0025C4C651|nr:hypothetical protein [Maribacter sp.]
METQELNESRPKFRWTEYSEIITEFKKSSLNAINEKRNRNVNSREYKDSKYNENLLGYPVEDSKYEKEKIDGLGL